jgi:DNA-binding CsgD family transcriptional regulator
VLLRAFVGGALGEAMLGHDDPTLVGMVMEDLRDLLGVRGEPHLSTVDRWPKAMAQYVLGHADRVKSIRLRERELRVPQGPRETTRANAAGLTARQLEVVALLVEGLTNAEIAERLVVSQRTVEHHVAAVLAKVGATTRREVARRASELELTVRT